MESSSMASAFEMNGKTFHQKKWAFSLNELATSFQFVARVVISLVLVWSSLDLDSLLGVGKLINGLKIVTVKKFNCQISLKVTSLKHYNTNDVSAQLDLSLITNDRLFFAETVNVLVCLRDWMKSSHSCLIARAVDWWMTSVFLLDS